MLNYTVAFDATDYDQFFGIKVSSFNYNTHFTVVQFAVLPVLEKRTDPEPHEVKKKRSLFKKTKDASVALVRVLDSIFASNVVFKLSLRE